MNEKIEKVGATVKDKVMETIKKNPEIVASAAVAGGMLLTFVIGVKAGNSEVANLIGSVLSIYPKDNTVGQFLEDLNKMRG